MSPIPSLAVVLDILLVSNLMSNEEVTTIETSGTLGALERSLIAMRVQMSV